MPRHIDIDIGLAVDSSGNWCVLEQGSRPRSDGKCLLSAVDSAAESACYGAPGAREIIVRLRVPVPEPLCVEVEIQEDEGRVGVEARA